MIAELQDVTKRYLSFLRLTQDEDGTRVGVNQLLSDLKQLVSAHPSLGSHEFTVQPLERDICARMNGTDLIQILRNLAINAFQASPTPHAVDISGRILTEPLDLTEMKDGPEDRVLNLESFENAAPLVKISVRDTGPGIPHEILPKVFQPYFTTKSAKVGTGLGLSIIQRLVKQANGILHLRSIPGEGTTFTIYLPAVEGPVTARP